MLIYMYINVYTWFQVNQWLTWLEEAESEDEDDEDDE